MHVIVCSSENEINRATMQHLAMSALLSRVEREISSGDLNEKTEREFRLLCAQVRAAFKISRDDFSATLERVSQAMAAE